MFSYDTLLATRNFELFLNFGESPLKQNPLQKQKKPNILEEIVNYFTGKSNFYYSYKYNKDINDIEYSFPRTFFGDLKSLRDYIITLFDKDFYNTI